MTRGELLVEILKATAWPITVIVVVCIFRGPLASLIRLVASVKYKDLEITIARDLEAAREGISSKPESRRSLLDSKTKDFSELLSVSPRAAIIEAWTSLESAGYRAVERTVPKEPGKVYLVAAKFDEYLSSHGHLDDHIRAALRRLKDIRNRVVHAGDYQPSIEDAEEYVVLAAAVTADLNAIMKA